jgi:peptidoglycan/LPS O-acetylase OafA/YrhL
VSARATVAGIDTANAGRAFDFPCFDGLRAVAVISAMVGHVGFVSGNEFEKRLWFAKLVSRPEVGPVIFFMISGFLLYRGFCSAAFAGRAPLPPLDFYRRRALRIVPAYWLALTAILLFGYATNVTAQGGGRFSSFTGPQLVALYSLTQIYSKHWFYAGMSQSWTLAVEISFYLMLPAYALLMRKLGAGRGPDSRLRVELCGALALVAASFAWRTFVFYGGVLPLLAQHWLPGYLDVFGLGMAVAAVHVWSTQTGGRVGAFEWAGRHANACFVLALGAFLVVALGLDLPRRIVEIGGIRAFARNLFLTLAALLLVLPAVFGPQEQSVFRRVLRCAPMMFVGIVSYGVYLWHNLFLEQARAWAHYPVFKGNFAMLFTMAFSWSVLVATVSYFLVEQPILRLKDRR